MSLSTSILLTEDDQEMSQVLRFLLEREGYEVTTAEDGREALELIEEMNPPSLVLLDVMLPYVSGHQLVDHIRDKPDWREVPIVMLSAKSAESDVVHALDAGADDYVIKPFRPMELLARIRRFLANGNG